MDYGKLQRPAAWLACLLAILCVSCAAAADAPPAAGEGGRVTVRTGWTEQALYLAFEVDDPMVVGNQTQPNGQPWRDDAIGIYLNLTPQSVRSLSDQCVRVVLSAAGGFGISVQRGNGESWRNDPAWTDVTSPGGTIRAAVEVLGTLNDSGKPDKGYRGEVALPWKLLKMAPPIRRRPTDPLPAIGLALACYSRGETEAVTCWPGDLEEADLNVPTKWGVLQFEQSPRPVAVPEPMTSASFLPIDPLIDGEPKGLEWIYAGGVSFRSKLGLAATLEPGRQAISLLAAWYQLDPLGLRPFHQELQPVGPWSGPDTPLYHLVQLRDVRRVGIDALAVSLPAVETARPLTRARLAALAEAMTAFERANTARDFANIPYLFPVVDLAGAGPLDLRSDAGRDTLTRILDDFYRAIPPQHRLMVQEGTQGFCYPVVLADPAVGMQWDGAFTDTVGAYLQARHGAPVGWMLDDDWRGTPGLRHVLCVCDWDPTAGVHQGDGPMTAVTFAPGLGGLQQDPLPRRSGEVYENGWLRVSNTRPDLALIRSWNDYAQGTEVSPSRQWGSAFLEKTQLGVLGAIEERNFGIRVLHHNLPPVLRGGVTYPVDITVKNGSLKRMGIGEGFRVDYRVTKEGREILAGQAVERMLLLDMTPAHVHCQLPTRDKRNPLPPGLYELHLDFARNRMPFFTSNLLAKRVATVSIPFTIGEVAGGGQLVATAVPTTVAVGATPQVTAQVRNLSGDGWRKRTAVTVAWYTMAGNLASGEVRLTCPEAVAAGAVGTFTGTLPPAPQDPGDHVLRLALPGEPPTPLGEVAATVTPVDLRLEFVSIGLAHEMTQDAPEQVPITARNCGASPWKKGSTRLTYQWFSWDMQPLFGAEGGLAISEDVAPGGTLTLRLPVTPPDGSGLFRLAFGVEQRGQVGLLTAAPADAGIPVGTVMVRAGRFLPLDISSAMDPRDWAADSDTSLTRADFDGFGNAFPLEEFLPDATQPNLGYKPGYYLDFPDVGGPGFRFMPPVDGRAPTIRGRHQEIGLPGVKASALHLVATNLGATGPVTFTIRYADGDEPVQLRISDWTGDSQNGEPVVLRSRHLHALGGDRWTLAGSLFAYRIALDPTRTLKGIILPNDHLDDPAGFPAIAVFAMTLEAPPGQ